MAVLRDNPYGRFNFLVDLGTGETEAVEAGFEECSQIGMEVAVAEYRNGNDKPNQAARNVAIHLQNEDHTAVVLTWRLIGARPVKHVSGPLNAKGGEVAMEELTLAYERLELE